MRGEEGSMNKTIFAKMLKMVRGFSEEDGLKLAEVFSETTSEQKEILLKRARELPLEDTPERVTEELLKTLAVVRSLSGSKESGTPTPYCRSCRHPSLTRSSDGLCLHCWRSE